MSITFAAALTALGLFGGILLLVEVGRRIGIRRMARDSEGARAGMGAVEGAVFGLMGLLIAFTFSGAASRFDSRRQLVTEEANDIGTAWLRLDLLPAGAQPALRASFRRYVDTRLEVYQKLPDSRRPWRRWTASDSCKAKSGPRRSPPAGKALPPPAMLLLPALNQMFDITTTRTDGRQGRTRLRSSSRRWLC